MIAALLVFAQVSTTPAQHAVTQAPAIVLTRHERHVRHELHLMYLHNEHEAHLARLSARRHDATSGHDTPTVHLTTAYSGHLGCGGLMSLWDHAGGNPGEAFIAAEVAMAESGGNQYATGPAGERGYWQIHPDHGALSTYDPYGNARAAIIISDDGRSWYPWTTYTSGAYVGRCLGRGSLTSAATGRTRLVVLDPFAVTVNGPFCDCA